MMKLSSALLASLLLTSLALGGCADEEATDVLKDNYDEASEEGTVSNLTAGAFKLMTYNVRYQGAEDTGVRTWANRRASLFSLIESNNPDIFGVQEAQKNAIDYPTEIKNRFSAANKAYDVIDPGGGSPKLIFFRRGRFSLADTQPNQGQAELSNPNESATCGSVNAKGKKAVWAKLTDSQSGKTFLFINTHLAFGDCPRSREAQALDIKKLVNAVSGGLEVVIFGDMNYDPQAKNADSENTVNLFVKRGRDMKIAGDFSGTTNDAHATFNSEWNSAKADTHRLDYVFFSGGIKAVSTKIDKTRNGNGVSPSDHYPFISVLAPG